MAKEKNYFWAFFVIALVVGVVLGFVVNGTVSGMAVAYAIADSDGGKDFAVAGECITQRGAVYPDSCISATTLKEYSISQFKVCAPTIFNCKIKGYAGCLNGACVDQAAWEAYQKQIAIQNVE